MTVGLFPEAVVLVKVPVAPVESLWLVVVEGAVVEGAAVAVELLPDAEVAVEVAVVRLPLWLVVDAGGLAVVLVGLFWEVVLEGEGH